MSVDSNLKYALRQIISESDSEYGKSLLKLSLINQYFLKHEKILVIQAESAAPAIAAAILGYTSIRCINSSRKDVEKIMDMVVKYNMLTQVCWGCQTPDNIQLKRAIHDSAIFFESDYEYGNYELDEYMILQSIWTVLKRGSLLILIADSRFEKMKPLLSKLRFKFIEERAMSDETKIYILKKVYSVDLMG